MSSSLALTMPPPPPTARSQGCTLLPVLVRVGDHRRPDVDVVRDPGCGPSRIQSSSTSAPGLTTHDSEAMCSQSSAPSSGRSSICQPKLAVSREVERVAGDPLRRPG